eukprot:331399-Amphidinium_carterae.1
MPVIILGETVHKSLSAVINLAEASTCSIASFFIALTSRSDIQVTLAITRTHAATSNPTTVGNETNT